MAISAGQLVTKTDTVNKFIERVMDFCRSNGTGYDYGISPFQWPSGSWNGYRNFTYCSNVYPGDPGTGNIPSGYAIASEVSSMVIGFANTCTRVARARFRYNSGGSLQVRYDRVTSLSTNYLSSLSQTAPTYNVTSGNLIHATNFLNYIENIRSQYSSRRNTVVVNFDICHSSCHGNCHGSRGRR